MPLSVRSESFARWTRASRGFVCRSATWTCHAHKLTTSWPLQPRADEEQPEGRPKLRAMPKLGAPTQCRSRLTAGNSSRQPEESCSTRCRDAHSVCVTAVAGHAEDVTLLRVITDRIQDRVDAHLSVHKFVAAVAFARCQVVGFMGQQAMCTFRKHAAMRAAAKTHYRRATKSTVAQFENEDGRCL